MMKRNRAVAASSEIPDSPTKSQKRCKGPASKGEVRAWPASAETPRNEDGGESKRATMVGAVTFLAPPAETQEEEGHLWLDGAGELECLWGWGVEEDLLLGWFPFVDEHFLCSENSGGSSLFWEEDHDIWQLQHIYEIPNSAK